MRHSKYIPEDHIGKRFGHLTVLGISEHVTTPSVRKMFCRCDCGVEKFVALIYLLNGNTRSCSCRLGSKIRKHGFARRKDGRKKPLAYHSWMAARERCFSPRHPHFDCYGGRGITMCDRWKDSFANFHADMGDRDATMSLERIDVNGNYEPSNCKWIPKGEQMDNLRSSIRFEIAGQAHSPKTASVLLGIDAKLVRAYYYRGEINKMLAKYRPDLLAA